MGQHTVRIQQSTIVTWGRADHCWGTAVAKNLARKADIGSTSSKHRSCLTGGSIKRPAFKKQHQFVCRDQDGQSYNTTAGGTIHSKYNVPVATTIVPHNVLKSRGHARLLSYTYTTENSTTLNKLRQFNAYINIHVGLPLLHRGFTC